MATVFTLFNLLSTTNLQMDLASDRKMDVFIYPTEIQLDPTAVLWNPDPQVLITDPILPIYERF